MALYALGDSNPAVMACKELSRRTLVLTGQRSRVWFMSLICGLGSAEAFLAGILPVAVTAPPPVRTDRHRLAAPRSFTSRRVRRKTGKWDGDDGGGAGDEGYDWFYSAGDGGYGGGLDGGFGFGGGDSGRGWSYGRGRGWGEGDGEGEGCGKGGDTLKFVYQVACWVSLSHCLHFAFKKVLRLIRNGVKDSSPEAAAPPPFKNCTSVIKKNLAIQPLVLENVMKPNGLSI